MRRECDENAARDIDSGVNVREGKVGGGSVFICVSCRSRAFHEQQVVPSLRESALLFPTLESCRIPTSPVRKPSPLVSAFSSTLSSGVASIKNTCTHTHNIGSFGSVFLIYLFIHLLENKKKDPDLIDMPVSPGCIRLHSGEKKRLHRSVDRCVGERKGGGEREAWTAFRHLSS